MRTIAIGLGLLPFLLSACGSTGTVVTHQDVDRHFYQPSLVNRAALDGRMPAWVIGEPLPGVTADAALAPLDLPTGVSPRKLFSYPEGRTRVVLLFNPLLPLPRTGTCQPAGELAANAGTAGERFSVMATLCQGERQVSTAIATGPRPASVDDPAYAATVESALLEIMPLNLLREPLVNLQ